MEQNKLHIPARFQLMGQTFNVQIQSPSPRNNKGKQVNGIVYHNGSNSLLLRSDENRFARTQQERTFIHELIHAVVKVTGQECIIHDEAVIDALAYGLHQALTQQSEEEAKEVYVGSENNDQG